MSGICVAVDFGQDPVERTTIERMIAAANHRGPDGTALWLDRGVGLGHLALHTTPESQAERMPLVKGDLALVADARLDNRGPLRETLAPTGLISDGESTDADLILAAYRHWGSNSPAHLVGDFAFALWDAANRTVFAARDATGSRPLYLRKQGRRLFISSEIKQILAVWGGPNEVNEHMLGAYLASSGGRPEWTFYKGIDQLPAAHALQARAGQHEVFRFWDIDPELRIKYEHAEDYVEHFRELFKDVVSSRMRTTKPMGISLSGGIDSGAVASTMGHLLETGKASGEVRAFSYAFDDLTQSDERHISELIVKRYSLKSTHVPADDAWPLRDLPEHGPDRDEPLMGAYQVLHDRVYDAAKRAGIGTMFTGARGDNIAGGSIFDYLGQLRTNPFGTWRSLRTHASVTDRTTTSVLVQMIGRPLAAQILPGSLRRLAGRPESTVAWLRRDFVDRIGLDEIVAWRQPVPRLGSRPRTQRYHAVFDVLGSRGGIWNERNHARSGLGYIDPWSDRRLAEFAVAAPQHLFNKAGETKVLVRDAMTGMMPTEARRMAGKILPSPLYDRGVHHEERQRIIGLLERSVLAELGYVDAPRLLSAYRSNSLPSGAEWPVLSTELWLRRFWK